MSERQEVGRNVVGSCLEGQRKLPKAELLTKDKGALFLTDNQFDLQHQNETQKSASDGGLPLVGLPVTPRDDRTARQGGRAGLG